MISIIDRPIRTNELCRRYGVTKRQVEYAVKKGTVAAPNGPANRTGIAWQWSPNEQLGMIVAARLRYQVDEGAIRDAVELVEAHRSPWGRVLYFDHVSPELTEVRLLTAAQAEQRVNRSGKKVVTFLPLPGLEA